MANITLNEVKNVIAQVDMPINARIALLKFVDELVTVNDTEDVNIDDLVKSLSDVQKELSNLEDDVDLNKQNITSLYSSVNEILGNEMLGLTYETI